VVVEILAAGTVALDVLLVVAVALAGYDRLSGGGLDRVGPLSRGRRFLRARALELAFAQALLAVAGSLYLSVGLGWTPCRLCWLQRIAAYPLVVVLGVGLLRGRRDARAYAAPLALLGVPVATYHYLLQRTDLVGATTCSLTGPSCATADVLLYGYVTVPAMSLTAFLVVLALLWVADGGASR
jgi:disulfide bond formation protein DsbB